MRKTCLVVLAVLIAFMGFAVAEDVDYADPVVVADSRSLPDYPPAALHAGFEGVVAVAAVVNADGSLGAIEIIEDAKPHLGFGDAAIHAIKDWHFQPAMLDGQAVDSVGAFIFRFNSVGRVDPSAFVNSDLVLSRAIVSGIGDKNGGIIDRGFNPASILRKSIQQYGKPPATPYQMYDRTKLIPPKSNSFGRNPPSAD